MIRAGSGRTRMSGHRARSRGMCLLPIQESLPEELSEHVALSPYHVVGVVPDANGFGKPDILMAKRVRT